MKACLLIFILSSAAFGRVVLLTTVNPSGRHFAALSADAAKALDGGTDLALYERADGSLCKPPTKPEWALLKRAPSPEARAVESRAELADLIRQAQPDEPVTIYAVSWDRRLELRGLDATPVPTEALLPRWVEGEFPQAAEAILNQAAGKGAAVVFADLADGLLDRRKWEALGVWFPKEAPATAAPFLTRVDFRRPKRVEAIGFASKNNSPRVHPRLGVRKPFTEVPACPAAEAWKRGEPERARAESIVLHELTGWPLQYVLSRVGIHPPKESMETVQP